MDKRLAHYQDKTPILDLPTFLDGKIEGSGMITNWRGLMVQQFDFSGTASWQGDNGQFNETMRYYDGKVDQRIWQLTRHRTDFYTATTKDLKGQAKIYVKGNAMQWHYSMYITNHGKRILLHFDDWMFLMHDEQLLNINTFKKFGLQVGGLFLAMRKV